MDYKYIEQLLESYWACTATEQEERILRTFFQQDQLPPHLHRYRSLFAAEEQMASTRLSDDFERRLLAQIGSEATPCRARRISLSHRLRPFFHAAGMLAGRSRRARRAPRRTSRRTLLRGDSSSARRCGRAPAQPATGCSAVVGVGAGHPDHRRARPRGRVQAVAPRIETNHFFAFYL